MDSSHLTKTTLNGYEHDSSCSNLHGVEKVVDPSNFLPLWYKAPKREEKKKDQHSLLILLDRVPINIITTSSSTSTCDILVSTIIIVIVVGGERRRHHRPLLAMSGRNVALTPGALPHGLQGGSRTSVWIKLWLLLLLLLIL